VQTDEDGRITATTDQLEYAGTEMFGFTFPDDFDFLKQYDYRIVDGELVLDPPQKTEEIAAQTAAQEREQIQIATVMMARMMTSQLTDEQAVQIPLIFPEWKDLIGKKVKADETILRYEGELYRVAQDHTVQEQWVPGETGTESLYTHISFDPETGYEEWQRPLGSHDAYSEGDIVTHNGKVWVSTVPGEHTNVWEPGVYGWKEKEEE
jgi:hypothetical protein